MRKLDGSTVAQRVRVSSEDSPKPLESTARGRTGVYAFPYRGGDHHVGRGDGGGADHRAQGPLREECAGPFLRPPGLAPVVTRRALARVTVSPLLAVLVLRNRR